MGFVWVSFVSVALQILLVKLALSALLGLLGFSSFDLFIWQSYGLLLYYQSHV